MVLGIKQTKIKIMIFLLLLSCHLSSSACSGYDCLKEYVDKEDPAFQWTDLGQRLEDGGGWKGYVVNMTSQQWLTPELVSRSVWWHQLVIIVPDEIQETETAGLWIAGGTNRDDDDEINVNSFYVQFLSQIATTNKMVTAILYQVPNQPVVYSEDILQDSRYEDAIIAFGWWHYLNDPESNPEYLLRLPMTKAAVKAMDAINYFLTDDTAPEELQGLGLNPNKFIVGGASKRGWTTWTTATVDPRVIGIMPTVMDELNFIKNIKHHWMSLGGWTFQFEDYWKLNLTVYFDDPKMQELFNVVDVYEYKEKMMMPKLVICGANDEFFLPTDTRYWWTDMPLEYELNRLLLLPNSGHGVDDALTPRISVVTTWIEQVLNANKNVNEMKKNILIDSLPGRSSYMESFAKNFDIPKFNWTHEPETGDLTVISESKPFKVELWSAVSCNSERRDWRLANLDNPCECGTLQNGVCFNDASQWTHELLEETSEGSLTWSAHKDAPENGRFLAFYITLHYQLEDGKDLEFCTTVSVVPDMFPYQDCNGQQCLGTLV